MARRREPPQALSAWGRKKPVDISGIKQPVLIVNGDDDRMVPTPNSYDLARRLPNSTLVIYPDAGLDPRSMKDRCGVRNPCPPAG